MSEIVHAELVVREIELDVVVLQYVVRQNSIIAGRKAVRRYEEKHRPAGLVVPQHDAGNIRGSNNPSCPDFPTDLRPPIGGHAGENIVGLPADPSRRPPSTWSRRRLCPRPCSAYGRQQSRAPLRHRPSRCAWEAPRRASLRIRARAEQPDRASANTATSVRTRSISNPCRTQNEMVTRDWLLDQITGACCARRLTAFMPASPAHAFSCRWRASARRRQ